MLPFQKRFLPLSRVVEYNFLYYNTKANVTFACQRTKFNYTDAHEIDFGRGSFEIMDDLERNDPAGLERYIREKMTKVRFTCIAEAERYVGKHGKIMKLLRGNWRVIVNINGVKCICYNTTRDLAVRDAGVQLQQEFPEGEQSWCNMTRDEKVKRRTKSVKYRQMIRTFDDPILSQVCEPVDRSDKLDWLPVVANVCNAFPRGVGLAAPQAGIAKQAIFVYYHRKNGYFMLNPAIIEKSEEMAEGEEGCLSYPDCNGLIKRHTWIVVEYYTENWEKVTRKITGFEAVIVQHEIDHLFGICKVKEFWKKMG